jgi:hypothetical protein
MTQESSMAWGGKLQMMQSPTIKGSLNHEAVTAFGNRSGFLNGLGGGASGKSQSSSQRRAQSASQLDITEVRALANDHPYSAEQDPNITNKSEHGTLMMRLKSREARAKAESNRDFLTQYRISGGVPDPKADDKLDKLLKSTETRAEELRSKSEELQVEAADAERKLERANAQIVSRASEQELQAMNPFERSQRRIQEDKREEELQKLRDEAQANYVRVHRRLQNELIELRDYKVLLVEFRRLRLEKLQETLGRVRDGRRLRACIRETIRHGAQRILGRLETAAVPLEQWMREVLVNSCHLELRIEDAEGKLLRLRQQALKPVKGEVQEMVGASKQDRFEALCARTWDNRLRTAGDEQPSLLGHRSASALHEAADESGTMDEHRLQMQGSASASGLGGPNAGFRGATSLAGTQKSFVTRVPDDVAAEMHTVEADIAAVKRLLTDMRANAAAVVCHQIREAEKTGGRPMAKEALEDGFCKLKLLVNEDFAKTTMKELQKSAPQGKFVF